MDSINYEESVNSAMENREPVDFEKRVALKVVQQLMGHAHYSTTIDIYTHVTEDMLES